MHRGKKVVALRGVCLAALLGVSPNAGAFSLEVKQITTGPENHFLGHLGRAGAVSWNQGGRYLLALRVKGLNRLPEPDDEAEIVLLDARNGYTARVVDRTRAWTSGEGGLLYWNPASPEFQFFFNDRDTTTGNVYSVLFDLSAGDGGERVREYRYPEPPLGNSGVAQRGGWFLGLNYGRIARLRPAAGESGRPGSTPGRAHPLNDGVFKVKVDTMERQLLVSFATLAAAAEALKRNVDGKHLFVGDTLWSRDDSRVFFIVRTDFTGRSGGMNLAFLTNADGSNLRPLRHPLSGHLEWLDGHRMIGALENRQVVYDTDRMRVATVLGGPETFPDPEGDLAVSPDGEWFVNGYRRGACNYYVVMHLPTRRAKRSPGFDVTGWTSGELRLRPAPRWSRTNDAILVEGQADDAERTRQLFLIRVRD